MPAQPQGEAICFATDDLSLYTLSEGANPPLYRLTQIHISGDVTGDGVVNADDLAAVILAWGSCPPAPASCPADINGDAHVDADDLVAVVLNWT
jgi:hypothetical protein